jgi:hypothetical protein
MGHAGKEHVCGVAAVSEDRMKRGILFLTIV